MHSGCHYCEESRKEIGWKKEKLAKDGAKLKEMEEKFKNDIKVVEQEEQQLAIFERQHRLCGTVSADVVHRAQPQHLAPNHSNQMEMAQNAPIAPPWQHYHQMLPSDGQFVQYHQGIQWQNPQPYLQAQNSYPPMMPQDQMWPAPDFSYPFADHSHPTRPDSVMVLPTPVPGTSRSRPENANKVWKNGRGVGWERIDGEMKCLFCKPHRVLESPDGRMARAHMVKHHLDKLRNNRPEKSPERKPILPKIEQIWHAE